MSELFKAKQNKKRGCEHEKIRPVLDLTRTVDKELLVFRTRPWDAIPSIRSYITSHGHEMPYDEYDEIADGIWVHVTAYLSPMAHVEAPTIICGGAKVCHGAFVEGSVIGSFATVGELSTVKDSIIFDRVRIQGHNFISSSIIGYEAAIGAGTVICDTRLDGEFVTVDMPEGIYVTGKEHLGAVVCDGVRIGASCVINPGAVIDTGSTMYPLTSISGYAYPYSTIK